MKSLFFLFVSVIAAMDESGLIPKIQTYDLLHDMKIQNASQSSFEVPYGHSFVLDFTSHNESFHLNLRVKKDLFTHDVNHYEPSDIEGEYKTIPAVHQHISYEAINFPREMGFARISIMANNDFMGLIKRNGTLYVIENVKDHWDALDLPQKRKHLTHDNSMVMYRYSDTQDGPLHHELRRLAASGRMRKCTWSDDYEITVGMASDVGHTTRYGSLQGTKNRIMGLMNQINAVYLDQVGVHMRIGAWILRDSLTNEAWNKKSTCACRSRSGA